MDTVVNPVTMLWFDNTPEETNVPKHKTFDRKVGDAASYYENKYRLVADKCVINLERFRAQLEKRGLPADTIDFKVGAVVITGGRGMLPWDMYISGDRRAE